MKQMTCNDALELLKKAEITTTHNGWIIHSKCVGETAAIIAEKLGLDSEKARVLGYIHDIGKREGDFKNHVMNGYYYIKELGYAEDYYNICLTHSYLNNDVCCTGAGIPTSIPFRTEFIKNHEYTIYEKIITLCDLMCTRVVNTIDKRLIEVMIRRGVHSNTQYHIKEAYKLKKYFDELLGYNLYDLFPEIKENIDLMTILDYIDSLNLPNYYIAAGAIFQTIWNYYDNLPLNSNIKDIDIIYYDINDLSKESEQELENKVIEYLKKEKLNYKIDIHNEARMQ